MSSNTTACMTPKLSFAIIFERIFCASAIVCVVSLRRDTTCHTTPLKTFLASTVDSPEASFISRIFTQFFAKSTKTVAPQIIAHVGNSFSWGIMPGWAEPTFSVAIILPGVDSFSSLKEPPALAADVIPHQGWRRECTNMEDTHTPGDYLLTSGCFWQHSKSWQA